MKARHFVSIALGAALAIAFSAWAQSGYPTRPRFMSFGVNANAPTANGRAVFAENAGGGQTITMRGGTNSSANTTYIRWERPDATSIGFIGDAGGADNNVTLLATSGDVVVRADAGNITLGSGGGGITFGAGAVAWTDFARLSQSNLFTGASLELENNAPALIVDEADGAGSAYIQFNDAGVTRSFVGGVNAANNLCGPGTAQGDLCLRAETGSLWWSADGGTTAINLTPSSGTFTASYTNACTTTPTQSIRWYKIGNLVTMSAAAALSCTADTTVFDTDSLDIPAAIRPTTSNVFSAGFGANNNGTSVTAMIELNGGEIIVNRCGAVTGTCDGGAWTGSGTRGLDAWTLSYIL